MHVSNLHIGFEDEHLKKLFEQYGMVSSAKIITDDFTNQSRGYGFVEMSDNHDAETAIRELDGKLIDGHLIRVAGNRPRGTNHQ